MNQPKPDLGKPQKYYREGYLRQLPTPSVLGVVMARF